MNIFVQLMLRLWIICPTKMLWCQEYLLSKFLYMYYEYQLSSHIDMNMYHVLLLQVSVILLSFSKQRVTSFHRAVYNFHTAVIIRNKHIKQKTTQYNDQSHLVCVEHGFVVNKTHASRSAETIRFECVMLHLSIIQIVFFWYSISCLRHSMTVHVFCKIFKKFTPNAHWIQLVNVLVEFPFDMQISLSLKIQSIFV